MGGEQEARLPDRSAARPRRVLGGVVLVVAVSLLLLAAGTGVEPAAAQDGQDNITIERTGANELTLNLDEAAFDEPETVNVELVDPEGAEPFEFDLSENQYESTVPVEGVLDVLLADTTDSSLANATVELTAGGQTYERTVSLQYLTVHHRPATITADDELAIPLEYPIGVSSGESVELRADDGTTISGTVRPERGTILVDRAAASDLEWQDGVQFSAFANGERISAQSPEIRAELRQADGLVLWHPAIAEGETYRVSATDGDGGRYASDITANRSGSLKLPTRLAQEGDQVSVTMTHTDTAETLLDTDQINVAEPFDLSATVSDDGSTLRFDQPVHDLTVFGVLDASGSEYHTLTGTTDGRSLALGGYDAAEKGSVFLDTAAGTANVSISSASAERSGGSENGSFALLAPIIPIVENGVLFLGPILIGLLIGLGMTRVRRGSTFAKQAACGSVGLFIGGATIAGLQQFLIGSRSLPILGETGEIIAVGVSMGIVSGLTALVTYTLARPQSGGLSGQNGASKPGARPSTFTASVAISDGNRRLDGRTTVHCTPQDQTRFDRRTVEISGGSGRIELPSGTKWTLVAERGAHSSNAGTVQRRASSASLQIHFPDVSVKVQDAERGAPVADATVELDADGTTETGTTNRQGVVTLEPPETATAGTLSVSHERYESDTTELSLDTGVQGTLDIVPKTGSIDVRTRIDGAETGPLTVGFVPDETALERLTDGGTIETDAHGRGRTSGVIAGTYLAAVRVTGPFEAHFDASRTRVAVADGETTTATVDATFTWSLSERHRERLRGIRADVNALGEGGGRDTTIPEYYGSVVHAVLDAVEAMPDDGGQYFATTDSETTPDELADAMLHAAARATETIDEAMTTKRSIDLFAACSDMSDTHVRWNGTADVSTLFDRLETDRMSQRDRVKERYETVSSGVESRRGEIAELEPVQEMLDRSWRLVNEGSGSTTADGIAIAHVALLLLDAVEQTFEHDSITKRLSRTVF